MSSEVIQMYRHGHLGISLLTLAPLIYVLTSAGHVAIPILVAIGILTVEPLPDNDQWIPGLSHRGTSHSFTAATIVGVVCAGLGWVLGHYVTVPLAKWVQPRATATDVAMILTVGEQLAILDSSTLAGFGFVVGVGGICVHLAGDIITVSGIQPFLPFSPRRVPLSGLRADSMLANSVLFLAGTVAMVAVDYTLSPFAGGLP
ncbi:hypothetical protein DMJ13_22435 [halophilic archaeon]|nr:hypothetical protein DMJ13_22435 [halophilic archaeon]